MINDLNIYRRISDLLYKDMLGLADEEEKRELDFVMGEVRSPLNLEKRVRKGSRPKSSTKKKAKKGKGKKK